MTKDEALKLALEALGNTWTEPKSEQYKIEKKAIAAIKEALAQPSDSVEQEPEVCCGDYATCIKPCTPRGRWLAQPVQEPVAWMCTPFGDTEYEFSAHQECENCVPCYATPTKREGVKLTDEQIMDAFCVTPGIHQFVQAFKAGARYAEAAHGIKENT